MDKTQQAFHQFTQMQQLYLMQHFAKMMQFPSSGLKQLQEHCEKFYLNHTQPVTCYKPEKSFLKDRGTDPLDYVYVYKNAGQPEHQIPKHWHYVGFGLSDIHGYSKLCEFYEMIGREYLKVYPLQKDQSGFGFELTMRVKCNSEDEWRLDPPRWPEKVLQDLARYVFQTKNTFNVGDHVAWHSPLDSCENGPDSSRIEHMLIAPDPQLAEIVTHHGRVKFIQVVGVCNEELDAARQWNVPGILEMMKERGDTGGPFLITDMRRGETIFDLDPDKYDRLLSEIKHTGSSMAQITAKHKVSPTRPDWFNAANRDLVDADRLARYPNELDQVAEEDEQPPRPSSRMSLGSESDLNIETVEGSETRYYNSMYLLLSYEAASVLHVMLNGRLAHKRDFSIQNSKGDSVVSFIPEGCSKASLVNPPNFVYAKLGHCTQIYIPDELRRQMQRTIMPDFSQSRNSRQGFDEALHNHATQLILPCTYSWPEFNLHITIVEKIADD